MQVNDDLLKEVKDYLKITWNDEVTNSNITKFILQGIETINGLVGVDIDYDKDLESRSLLKDARHYSLEYFEDNFQKTILRLQINYAVKEQN